MKKLIVALSSSIASVALLLALVPSGLALTANSPQKAIAVPDATPDLDTVSFYPLVRDEQLLDKGGPRNSHLSRADATAVEWDDADSRKWIGENWDSADGIDVDWVDFQDRKVLRAVITSRGKDWAFMRTDAFPSENWENMIGLRADVYQVGGTSNADIKLEVRGGQFDPPVQLDNYCDDLPHNVWYTCTWPFNSSLDYSAISYLSMVFDHLKGTSPTFYVDNLRLISATGEEEWDDVDDGSRWWFYFGNWYNWKHPDAPFGLEPISHNGRNPNTPAGSVYLQWDYLNGVDPGGDTAEVGTKHLDDQRDWSNHNRISADVKVSVSDIPLSLSFWHTDTQTQTGTGFGTPAQVVREADTWQIVRWDLPWPSWFNDTDIDIVKFVVNGIDTHTTGTLYIDNIFLISDPLPSPLSGLEYTFEDFDDRNEFFNDFGGNWGVLADSFITTTFVTDTYAGDGDWGASLKVEYDLPDEEFTGIWNSIWGDSDYTQTYYLDFTDIYGNLNGSPKDFEQLQFWVRGSGMTTRTHNVKVELKDTARRTAYRYITIDDGNTLWRQVALDADVTNADFWSYTLEPPDPTRMKQLVFVIESFFNESTGAFYIDDIRFVDADDSPFDPDQHTDDEFLDLVSERTFMYFLDWYDPNTGLFHDRSTFPDLMSIASTGFGLTALTIGESRGWIDRPLAIEMITRTLYTLRDGQTATDTVSDTITGTNGYKGFFYHFLGTDGLRKVKFKEYITFLPITSRDVQDNTQSLYVDPGPRDTSVRKTGEVEEGSELSPVDTAILLAGAFTAKEHFSDVTEIVSLTNEIYQRVDWEWMLDQTNPATNTNYNQFYLAWKPECETDYTEPALGGGCFSDCYWDYYTDEVILINLLSIGSSAHPVPVDTFYAWERNWGAYKGHSLVHSWNGSFFTYFFAHLWIDFAVLGPDHHPTPTLQVNWWDNSVEAANANWQFAVDHQDDTPCDGDDDYTTYGENSWGLTAAEGPDGNYYGYGAPPAAITPTIHDGTIAPYGAGSGIIFLPVTSTHTLKHYFSNTDLWRYRFGFGDAYNLDPPDCDGPWYNHAAFGIDQGPMLIAIENHRSGLVWETVARNEDISRALRMIFSQLAVSKQATPVLAQGGSRVTYTMGITNFSNFTLTTAITDTLPDHITSGTTSGETLILPGEILTWTPTILTPGDIWTQTIVVTIEVDYAGLLTNVIQVTSLEGANGRAVCIVDSRHRVYLPVILKNY